MIDGILIAYVGLGMLTITIIGISFKIETIERKLSTHDIMFEIVRESLAKKEDKREEFEE